LEGTRSSLRKKPVKPFCACEHVYSIGAVTPDPSPKKGIIRRGFVPPGQHLAEFRLCQIPVISQIVWIII
jgi:hypothetical protein